MGRARRRKARPVGCVLVIASLLAAPWASGPASADEAVGSGQGVDLWLAGLDFPVQLAFAPDGRAFVTERFTGNIRVIDTSQAVPRLLQTPLATVGPLNTSGEQGMLGVAVDPEFAVTPWVYVYFTYDDGAVHENRITRFWAATNVSNLSEPVLWGIPAGFFHNGGILKFGSDGKLYSTMGDASEGRWVQDTSRLNGKILRMEKNGSVPADNPFPGTYAYTMGHRNVFGIDENPRIGRMYVTENGEDINDEVNMLLPGANYGWPQVNGSAGDPRYQDPLWTISPTVAPTGIAFDASSFSGSGPIHVYVADWSTASVRRFTLEPPGYSAVLDEQIVFTRSTPSVVSLTFGPGGRLFLCTPGGIYTSDLDLVGNQPPVPQIYVSRPIQFVGGNISFGGGGSYDPEGGGIYSHHWEFGDGTSANGSWIVKSFDRTGTFTVTLTVTDEHGTANSTRVEISIRDPSQNQPPVARIYQNRTIQFVGRAVSFGGGESYDPDWGGIKTYGWDLGDGTTATGSWVSHAYGTAGTYSAHLQVTDEFGAAGDTTAELVVLEESQNTPPVAVPGLTSFPVFAGLPAAFSGAASSDKEGGIYGYRWDFGDGGSADNGTPRHVFARPGAYTVTLTVTDELGAEGSGTFAVGVLDPALNRAPVARITPPAGYAVNGQSVVLSAAESVDPEGGKMSFRWSFGNGGTAAGERVEYVYEAAGEYVVALEAIDELGAMGRAEHPLVVYQDGPPPTASFVMNDWRVALGNRIYFDGSSSNDPHRAGYIVDAWWDFGDGETARGLQVWHGYREPGRYNVTLTVLNDRGSVGFSYTYVEVGPREPPSPFALPIALLITASVLVIAVWRRPAP